MELLLAQAGGPSGAQAASFGIIQILQMVVGLVAIVCWILVLVKMFQNGQTGLGIVSICCGLVAFIVGWMNATQWGIKNVMLIWTLTIVVNIILSIVGAVVVGSSLPTQ